MCVCLLCTEQLAASEDSNRQMQHRLQQKQKHKDKQDALTARVRSLKQHTMQLQQDKAALQAQLEEAQCKAGEATRLSNWQLQATVNFKYASETVMTSIAALLTEASMHACCAKFLSWGCLT